ncbi:Pregnancy-associated glycoprotein 2 [Trametes pubescens]|uniref:Pregnancy-associated glycoprotein 2 n=1 Tax=Trametes pubescens TaxID=154538 RepID=A0A1M2VV92_TRAPU|nr:Pregnancy-associated glycoprotein 2 [Trametes pubescens]
MLPLFLLLSVLAFLDGASAVSGSWRPDMRRSLRSIGSNSARSRLHSRVLEGIVKDLPPADNSTIVPVVFSSDRQTYYVLAGVGSVSLRLALDTASADLWLVSTGCTSSACNIPKYPLTFESSTFVPVNSNGTTFNVTYADLTGAQGFVARESVSLGNLTVANQALGLANTSTVHFTDSMSGVLGLGFPRLSTIANSAVNATPFFANMAQNGQLDYPLFGLSLTRDSSGTLAFGAIDGSVVTNRSLVEWNEVVPFAPFLSDSNGNASSYLQWAIVLEHISVNGTAVTPEPTYPTQTLNTSLALFDAGTAGIYGPYQDVSRMYTLIDGARLVDASIGQWVVPCDTEQTMTFNFGGQDFVLQPTDYIIGPASGNPNLCLSWPRAMQPSADGIDWQLGSPFLRTVYSIYSFGINTKESPMVGLFPLANASAPVEPSASVSAFLASYSATVGTTLPNFLIPTPSPTAPSYTFNTSVSVTRGQIVKTGLATSTYVALLESKHQNATALPAITPSPTVATLVITDTSGHTLTSVSTAATPSITLGIPEGWTQNGAHRTGATGASWGVAAVLCALAWGVL